MSSPWKKPTLERLKSQYELAGVVRRFFSFNKVSCSSFVDGEKLCWESFISLWPDQARVWINQHLSELSGILCGKEKHVISRQKGKPSRPPHNVKPLTQRHGASLECKLHYRLVLIHTRGRWGAIVGKSPNKHWCL